MASIRDSLAGEPPAYTPTTPPFTYQRSIHDIRAQIHANGSILIPFSNDLSSMEVIVARTGPEGMAGGAGMEAATATSGIKHYAVLIHRSGVSYSIKWAYKGEPRDSVEEALQALLDLTETMLHRRIPSYAYTDKVGRCVVM